VGVVVREVGVAAADGGAAVAADAAER
jgi:hypothetical protein